MRYEDDFGSFWMVDDNEFVKRRHLSRGRPRKYEPSSDERPSNQNQQPSPSQNRTTKQEQTNHGPSNDDHTNIQPNAHLMTNSPSMGQPTNNGINHHYFSSPVATQ